jgi:hypothetical protein
MTDPAVIAAFIAAFASLLVAILGYFIGIPHIGINWVMAIPALVCLSVIVPLSVALRLQRHTLQSRSEAHTMEQEVYLPIIK